jgi:tRNA/rRNA methyltransferase
MSNFGFLRLRVVNPYDVAWREARSAVGASSLLANAEEFKNIADAISDCSLVVGTTAASNRELHHPLRSLPVAGREIRKRMGKESVALLFGSEKRGLSNQDLTHCHWLLRIPTRPEHASMNLGQAVAVCLYEFVRPPKFALDVPLASRSRKAREHASASELEHLTSVVLEALETSGYTKPRSAATTEEKVRRLIRRMNLSPDDAELLLGMLRKMAWKLQSGQT